MARRSEWWPLVWDGVLRRLVVVMVLCAGCVVVSGQQAAATLSGKVTRGGNAVGGIRVTLEDGQETRGAHQAVTAGDGGYRIAELRAVSYTLTVMASDDREARPLVTRAVTLQPGVNTVSIELSAANSAMAFADNPDFTVAGVTDFTAVGGHGSDATLRTSEELTRAAVGLGAKDDPKHGTMRTLAEIRAQLQASPTAELHREAAAIEEKSGDALAAVADDEQAARMDASEENTYAWASELLLHRAIWEAQRVFASGVATWPNSARMHTGLGTAMFSGARYGEAAEQLCRAVDLNPSSAETYGMLGRIQLAAPDPLACVEPRLRAFVTAKPANAEANYLYAMDLLKQHQQAPDAAVTAQASKLLEKAVALDPKCAEAYLELGTLAAERHDLPVAMEQYRAAISANPDLADAHYRLGVALDRAGDHERARQEFARHEALKRADAEAIERTRREVKQFVTTTVGDSARPAPQP